MKKTKQVIEKVIEAPAELLDKGIVSGGKLTKAIPINYSKPVKKARDFWFLLGPGLTTGASDDDPSGIATYSQTGAQFGFGLLWLAAFTFPLMAVIQEMCARIGLVTGRGLAANIRHHFNVKILYFSTILLFIANTFNIGADIGAMANAVQLLYPKLDFDYLIIGFGVVILLLQIFTSYIKYARLLKYLALVLFAYIISAILTHPNYHTLIHYALLPHITFNKNEILLICAILGTTITPYLFFWQTAQEVEEEISDGQTNLKLRQINGPVKLRRMRIDVWVGMFLSNLVMFFIITAAANVLFAHGITNINTASQAALALKPFAGDATYLLFALGIIGVGLLAIPILAASSAYAISETIGKNYQGLNLKLNKAPDFYGVIIISMILGILINFIGLNPIKALIYSAVLNGMVAPVIIVLIILLARNKKVMGQFKNSKIATSLGWVLAVLMSVSGIAAIYSMLP